MTAGRQETVARRRFLVGLAALLAPLPLPFNEVIGWPVLLGYGLAAGLLLRRAARPRPRWLPGWAVNLLGVLYLPVLWLDLQSLGGGQPIHPVLHMLLFALLVKLASLRREQDVWHLFLGAFFLFLAAMATSVHPTVVIYLLAWSALGLGVLARSTWDRAADRFGLGSQRRWNPFGRLVWGSLGFAVLLAVPLFFLLPRTGSPTITGATPLSGARGEGLSGLTDSVRLGEITRIRSSRRVAMRIRVERGGVDPARLRYKARALQAYEDGRWSPGELRQVGVPAEADGLARLASGSEHGRLEIWLQPQRSSGLPLPLSAIAIRSRLPGFGVDESGSVTASRVRHRGLEYEVRLGEEAGSLGIEPSSDQALDDTSLSPRVVELARRLTAGLDPMEAPPRLEEWLRTELSYTDRPSLDPETPIERFLFESRRGHCELFASALTLMLRSIGIPARLVVGYLGAEQNAIQGYWVVRDANAHAWVEAWSPEGAWMTLDPTPAAGRPQSQAGIGWIDRVEQAWDLLLFYWDRSVLGYGLSDQADLAIRMRRVWSWLARFFEDGEEEPTSGAPPVELAEEEPSATSSPSGASRRLGPWLLTSLLLVLAGVLGWLLWRRRSRPDPRGAWQRVLSMGRQAGVTLPPSTPPMAAARLLSERIPVARLAIARIVTSYLRASFAGEVWAPAGGRDLNGDLALVRRALAPRRAARFSGR